MERFINYVAMKLAAACLPSDLTLTVDDGSALPTDGNYRLIVDDEIVLATSRVGNIITVSRAQEGTAAAAHSTSTSVVPILTAGALKSIGGLFGPDADPITSIASDVTTADATPTTVAAGGYTLPDKTLCDVVVTVVGKRHASSESFVQDYRARYVRNGGAAMLIGTVISGANPVGTGSLAAASATILLSGNVIAPQVTGVAATNISWKTTVQVTPVATAT